MTKAVVDRREGSVEREKWNMKAREKIKEMKKIKNRIQK